MNDDQYLLASAYLDGELSADERVRAATDPDVMAAVEQLRGLAGDIAEVAPASATAREQAVGAALAEFRAAPAARRPVGTWLGVAAAAVAVLAVGAVVVTGTRGSDDDAGEAGDDAAQQTMEMVAADVAAQESAEEPAEPLDAVDSYLAGDADVVPLSEESAERAAEEPQPTSDGEAEAGGSLSTFDAADTAPPSAVLDLAAPLATLNDLSAYGNHLLVLEAQGELPPTPNTHCPLPDTIGVVDVLDTAFYVVDDTAVAVLIAVDRVAGLTLALDPDTCEVVADNRPP